MWWDSSYKLQTAPNHLNCRQNARSATANTLQATKVVLYTKSFNSVATNTTTQEITISSNNHHQPITIRNSQSINQPTPYPSTQIPRTQHHSYAEVAATNISNTPPPNFPDTQQTSSIDNNVLTTFLEDFKCIINPLISLLTTIF